MTKKILTPLGVVLTIVLGLHFGNVFTAASTQDSIYDDDIRIAQQGDSYSYVKRVGRVTDNTTHLSFNLSGMETLWTIKSNQESTLYIEFDSNIELGDCKLVLISPENTVTSVFEGSEVGHETFKLKQGDYRLKIVGRSTIGKVEFSLKASDGVKLQAKD